MPCFVFSSLSVRIAYGVVSVPVPAVVGSAIIGIDLRFGLWNKLYLVAFALFINTPAAFAESMGEPPPIPIIKFEFCILPRFEISSTVSKEAFFSALLKTSYTMPSFSNALVTSFNEPFVMDEVLPVTIKALFSIIRK